MSAENVNLFTVYDRAGGGKRPRHLEPSDVAEIGKPGSSGLSMVTIKCKQGVCRFPVDQKDASLLREKARISDKDMI